MVRHSCKLSKIPLANSSIRVGSTDVQPVTVVRHLGVMIDAELTMRHRVSRLGGVVALSVECRTCDQEGSTLGRARGVKLWASFCTPMCLCSPSSISWYWPKGSDALRLGSKGSMVRVWVAGKTV